MKHWMRGLWAAVAVLALALPGQAQKKATITVVNQSDWTITELYLSPADEAEWGPDQLAEHVIEPGASFKLSGIPCATWDVRLVDEDEDECVVEGVDICANKETWTITSKDLLRCQAASSK
jgi:hypothetical protein